jgi:hypothetical protein
MAATRVVMMNMYASSCWVWVQHVRSRVIRPDRVSIDHVPTNGEEEEEEEWREEHKIKGTVEKKVGMSYKIKIWLAKDVCFSLAGRSNSYCKKH